MIPLHGPLLVHDLIFEEFLRRHASAFDDINPRRFATDLLDSLLEYDPTQRPTASEALEHPYFEGE